MSLHRFLLHRILELTIKAVQDELSKLPSLVTDERLIAAGESILIHMFDYIQARHMSLILNMRKCTTRLLGVFTHFSYLQNHAVQYIISSPSAHHITIHHTPIHPIRLYLHPILLAPYTIVHCYLITFPFLLLFCLHFLFLLLFLIFLLHNFSHLIFFSHPTPFKS